MLSKIILCVLWVALALAAVFLHHNLRTLAAIAEMLAELVYIQARTIRLICAEACSLQYGR